MKNIRFTQTSTTDNKYKFVYNLKSNNRVDIKQNNIPVELRIEIIDTFKNNLN